MDTLYQKEFIVLKVRNREAQIGCLGLYICTKYKNLTLGFEGWGRDEEDKGGASINI